MPFYIHSHLWSLLSEKTDYPPPPQFLQLQLGLWVESREPGGLVDEWVEVDGLAEADESVGVQLAEVGAVAVAVAEAEVGILLEIHRRLLEIHLQLLEIHRQLREILQRQGSLLLLLGNRLEIRLAKHRHRLRPVVDTGLRLGPKDPTGESWTCRM